MSMRKFKLCVLCFLSVFIIFTFGTGIALAKRVSYSFVNYSGYTVKNLYITGTGYDRWGKDLLGKSVLNNGDGIRLTYDNKTRYFDIKVVWMDGSDSICRSHDYKSVWRVTLFRDGSSFYVKNN